MDSRLRIIIISAVVGIIAIPALVYLVFFSGKTSVSLSLPAANLTFWGFQDDELIWREVIENFHMVHPQLTVSYTRMNEETFESTLVDALARGKGPDLFLLKNEWIVRHKDKASLLPPGAGLTEAQFAQHFTDGLVADLVMPDSSIVGLPLFVDTPLLFYNKDILNIAGIAVPPSNWDELIERSRQLTRATPAGEIIRSGLAVGSYGNVERAYEVISSLILQYGDPIAFEERGAYPISLGRDAIDAVEFYTSFADRTHDRFSWTPRMKQSLDAFAEEHAVFAFGYAQDIKRIRAKNPHMNLGVLPFPQRKDAQRPTLYHTYFFPVVSRLSPHPQAAWEFIFFAALGEGAKVYLDASEKTPARRDLLAKEPPDAVRSIGHRQALIAKGWPAPDQEVTRRLLGEAIDSINARSATVGGALSLFGKRISQLFP